MAAITTEISERETTAHAVGCLSICLIGGIYGKDAGYRSRIKITPETTLERGFRERGHVVKTFGHREKIDLRGADIVHVHHAGAAVFRAAAQESRAGFVYTSHDGPAMAGKSASVIHRFANRFAMSRADAVVALSEAEASFQKHDYDVRGALHTVIPNGIDPLAFTYARKCHAGESFLPKLLYVGQLMEGKGVDVLLRALSALDEKITVDLVYHTGRTERDLRKLASELNLGNRVQFLGTKTPKELKSIYHAADILVLPSLGEALPSVITEAMLCGTPVISTDVGGIRDQMGGSGIVVAPNRVDELANAIRHMLGHYEDFSARAEEMSRYARERFSVDAMIEKHLSLYRAVVEKKSPRRRSAITRRPLNAGAGWAAKVLCKT
jgi:glycosyltransferase involved in cell wall biosynthesis